MRFDPEGMTTNPEIPFAKSLPDYIMRWLASRFLDPSVHEELGIMSEEVRAKKMAEEAGAGRRQRRQRRERPLQRPLERRGEGGRVEAADGGADRHAAGRARRRSQGLDLGPACSQCGGMMQRTGSCYTCSSCGNNTGCG